MSNEFVKLDICSGIRATRLHLQSIVRMKVEEEQHSLATLFQDS